LSNINTKPIPKTTNQSAQYGDIGSPFFSGNSRDVLTTSLSYPPYVMAPVVYTNISVCESLVYC